MGVSVMCVNVSIVPCPDYAPETARAALLAALALECRRLLRQLPARDMQQALSY